jgi:hypothetical protein
MAGTLVANTINTDTGLFSTNNAYLGIAKAWVYFTGNSGAILSSFNVSSVTHTGGGTGVINFTTAMSSANYAIGGMSYGIDANASISGQNLATGSFTWYSGASNSNLDKNQVAFIVFSA